MDQAVRSPKCPAAHGYSASAAAIRAARHPRRSELLRPPRPQTHAAPRPRCSGLRPRCRSSDRAAPTETDAVCHAVSGAPRQSPHVVNQPDRSIHRWSVGKCICINTKLNFSGNFVTPSAYICVRSKRLHIIHLVEPHR